MLCPVCSDPMLVFELKEVEIDSCLSCGGIWLDAGELAMLMESSPGKDELISSFEPASGVKEKKRKCPICLKKMEKIYCGIEDKILIDKCKKGDGLWFDSDELNSILRMASKHKSSEILNILEDMFANKNKEVR